jgi:perosamine synthetase
VEWRRTMAQIKHPVARPVLAGREAEYAADALTSGWISSVGPYVSRFECLFAQTLGVEQAFTVCNGTAALHLACLAMELKQGSSSLTGTA